MGFFQNRLDRPHIGFSPLKMVTLSPTIVTEKEFRSREVGKKSESPTFPFSIVTGLIYGFFENGVAMWLLYGTRRYRDVNKVVQKN